MEKIQEMKTNLIQTQNLAINLAKKLKKGDVVCLYGNLGSGKTTFTKGIGKGLGVIDEKLFSVVVIMVIVTTLITPPILAHMLKQKQAI